MQQKRKRQVNRRDVRRKTRSRRRYIYKPDYAGVQQIAVAKRIVGAVLGLLLAAAVVALLVVWVVPSVMRAAEPSPVVSETAEGEAESEAEPSSIGVDEKTGLPVYDDDFNLFVINEAHPADENFAVTTAEVAGIQVDERIAPALTALLEAAESAGMELEFSEGYVSFEEQAQRYQVQVDALTAAGFTKVMAREDAKSTAPMAGTSDLQSGLCVTIRSDAENFATTQIGSWLQTNMGSYGFVFRYPADKEKYTGCAENGLVLRYVGAENAAAMRRLSMCMEEYIDYLG